MSRPFTVLHRTVFLCAALLFAASAAHASAPAGHTLSLEKGVEKFVTAGFRVRRLSIGDTKIASISVIDGRTVRVLGQENGKTTFSLWRYGSRTPIVYTVVVSPKVVQIDAEVITVSRSALHQLGLNFTSLGSGFSIATSAPSTLHSYSLNANGNTGLDVSQALPIASAFNLLMASPRYNVLAVISALHDANYSKTLARPTLVVRSGNKANFLVGGEIPIPVPQGGTSNAITIQYKKFGVGLDVEPKVLDGGRIALKIKPSVSELDYSNGVTLDGVAVPALRTREAETTVEVDAGQPFLLAGLNFDTGSQTRERFPYLADIPVLGEFFKRRTSTHRNQELVIAVPPHIVTPETQDRTRQTQVENDYMSLSATNPAEADLAHKTGTKKSESKP